MNPCIRKMFELILSLISISACFCQHSKIFDTDIQNVVVNKNYVYVGAKNLIYKLNQNFDIEKTYVSGPKRDNKLCILATEENLICFDSTQDQIRVMTDNYNKILLVVKEPEKALLTCGTLYQGVCKYLDLDTLQELPKYKSFQSVSSNYPNSSIVALVAPTKNGNRLFVGRTIFTILTKDVEKLSSVLAGRRMKNTEHDPKALLKEKDFYISYNQRLVIPNTNRAQYLINYKFSFFESDKLYFLTVQRKSLKSSQYVSKVIRTYVLNDQFDNYIEQQISCQKNDEEYPILISSTKIRLSDDNKSSVKNAAAGEIVIVGLFASSALTKKYAICYFRLSEVDTALQANVDKCVKRQPVPTVQWFFNTVKCQSTTPTSATIAPTDVIPGTLVYTESLHDLQTIFGYSHSRGVALYLSGIDSLLELVLRDSSVYKYGERSLPSGSRSFFSQIVMDEKEENILLKSDNMLVRVAIKDCNLRQNCQDCLSSPTCGWCTLESKCSLKTECKNASHSSRFVDSRKEFCPAVTSVTPDVISVNSVKMITFQVKNIPMDVQYQCSVNGKQVPVTVSGSSFQCDKIDFKTVPNLNPQNGSVEVQLKLITRNDQMEIVTTPITVYNCLSLKMCQTCISGKFTCGWCDKCTDDSSSCASNSNWLISKVDSEKCPVVTNSTIYIPHGSDSEMVLKVQNMPAAASPANLQCILKYGNTVKKIGVSKIDGSKIFCQKTKITYMAEVPSVTVMIEVTYNSFFIDTSQVKGVIYKCHVNHNDCTLCILRPPKEWQCGWCKETKRCGIKDLCPNEASWIDKTCPGPTIESVFPTEGTTAGGTQLVIRGSNLGSSFKDVFVSIGPSVCAIVPEKYETSQVIVCNTTEVQKPFDSYVKVTVQSGATNASSLSKEMYFFRVPKILSLQPLRGPCSGGTKMNISGKYLNVGNHIEVFISGEKCELVGLLRNPNYIECLTAGKVCSSLRRRRRQVFGNDVEVLIDGFSVVSPAGLRYSYELDPIVSGVFTNKELIRIRTFASGGQVFKVEGQRLSIIQEPKMIFTVPSMGFNRASDCTYFHNISQMICLAPNVSVAMMGRDKIFVMLGFEMDRVANVRILKNVTVVKDPVVASFKNNVLEVKTEDLILTGSGLSVLSKADVQVFVGGVKCTVTDVDARLVCKLPAESTVLKSSTGLAEVEVFIGKGGLMYNPGFIKFYKATKEKMSYVVTIVVPIVIAIALIIIIVVLVILYRRKHRKEKKYQELVQLRMDRMESQYARECKEAFAEYQTEIMDLTQDVEQNVPPYHDFRAYAMRVLCPGLASHPIVEENCDEREEWKDAMGKFIDLMKNEDFLLTFIRTLEAQSKFQMNDRCIVASLLMVSLQDDVKYITSILKALLVDLIRKTGTSKRSKLLLRRTESVAEKLLTTWLAYVLHGFLESHVGEPLFKLFAAINILLEKEPIDAVTFDAKNSLSEDKLLRQKIDFKSLQVNVEYVNAVDGGMYDGIAVLSCDTIAQTKNKIMKHIYKNKPYTKWPPMYELLLGFVSANGALLVMQDEDSTNVIEGEWKKINTLEHYKVPENASLRLADSETLFQSTTVDGHSGLYIGVTPIVTSPRIVKSSSRRKLSSRSSRSMQELDKSDPALLDTSTQMLPMGSHANHSSTPMLNHQEMLNQPKLYHMVKMTDYPQEQKEDIRQSKMMAEVYLTRLLKTKETLQSFVNTLFSSIFGLDESGNRVIPAAVKYLFDFLDEEAADLKIADDEVFHTWKNNSLPLRFWINMIKNPDFIFDIKKSHTVDSCLSVIAQLFMDSCSPDDHRLGKDSPSNKLLYAKEIPEYKKKVKKFYADVRATSFNSEEFDESLDEISKKYGDIFNGLNAAFELMTYAVKYKLNLMENLEEEGYGEHAETLQNIMETIPDD